MSAGGVIYGRDERQRACYKVADNELAKEWIWSGSRLVAEYDYAADETSVFVYRGSEQARTWHIPLAPYAGVRL